MNTEPIHDHASHARPAAPCHGVLFYESQPSLVKTVAGYLGEGLQRGEGLAVIARPEHWAAIRGRLVREGALLDEATRGGRVVVLDAARMLSCIQVGGKLDEAVFASLVGAAFDMILSHAPRASLRAYGEMVDLLWSCGEAPQALALEKLWNGLLARRPMPLLCAYGAHGSGDQDRSSICAVHTHVAPAE